MSVSIYDKFYENFEKRCSQGIIPWKEQYQLFDHPLGRVIIGLFHRDIPVTGELSLDTFVKNKGEYHAESSEVYYDRLAKELQLVIDRNFIKLFVQVREILDLIDNDNVPHIIRGSAGSSLICYLMGITCIDPVKYKINLARFMHERRTDYPDIDIDFPWNKRDAIFKIIHDRWGKQVGRVSNHLYYRQPSALRQAIRDSGFTGFLPSDFNLNQIFPLKADQDRIYKRARQLVGRLKGYSLHCGGIVIFDEEIPEKLILKEYSIFKEKTNSSNPVPGKNVTTKNTILDLLKGVTAPSTSENERNAGNSGTGGNGSKESKANKGLQLTMDKYQIEKEGFIKIDILSNRGLGQLWDIEKRHLYDYPYDDPATYQLLSRGEIVGITYSESRAMMKIFMEMQPKSVDNIAEALALVRPSASQSYQKSDYLRNFHLILESPDTRLKYLIYDDDAIDYIQRMLNCDESIADTFRKAFAKNNKEKKQEFLDKLAIVHPGLTDDERIMIHDQLNRLNNYSFCKSHAYSYARLVYALAYQKVHNPHLFWLAALNNCHSSYRRWVHFREAARAGLEITYGRGPWKLEFLTEQDNQSQHDGTNKGLQKANMSAQLHAKMRAQMRAQMRVKVVMCNPNPRYEPEPGSNVEVWEGMLRWRYWIGPDFFPGMYFRSAWLSTLKPQILDDLLSRSYENKRKTLKRMIANIKTKQIEDNDQNRDQKIAFFKGLIACSRYHRTDLIPGHTKRDGCLITFCTIGYNDGKYCDLIIDRITELHREHYIEGAGIIKPGLRANSPVCIDVLWHRVGRVQMRQPKEEVIDEKKPKSTTKRKTKASTYDWGLFLQLSEDGDSLLGKNLEETNLREGSDSLLGSNLRESSDSLLGSNLRKSSDSLLGQGHEESEDIESSEDDSYDEQDE
jgi:hypothetical protein